MAIVATFSSPFFTGGVTTSGLVPDVYPVALAGRAYLVDLKPDLRSNRFERRSLQLQREQSDASEVPAEHSLNRGDAWRRATETWHHGAGQTLYDRPDSDPARFRTSKGVDVWSQWQLTLLADTANKRASANTNLNLIAVGTRLYLTDGSSNATYLQYTSDITVGSPTFTAVTGGPAAAPTSIASDGFNVWTAHTASGIYATTRTTGTTASYVTGTVTLLGYVKGRLMAANANSVYNITAAGALPPALLAHANTDFVWVGFAEGTSNIYLAGYSGDKSLIYKTQVQPDGTALAAPSVAGELPDGEIIRAIQGYLGFIVIGSDKGVRFATADSAGNLTIGSLITTTSAVQCFEPQDRFVWYGLTNYDATSSGLGRLDLSVFTAPLTPAYASDLMATAQGSVLSVVTFQNIRVFSVSAVGFFAQSTSKVTSGTLDSGLITYGLPDIKVALFVDLRHLPLVGTIAVSLSSDSGTFVSLGSQSTAGSTDVMPFPANQTRAETFETRITLTRATGDTTTGPTITRSTLRSYPAPSRGEQFVVPILLYEELTVQGATVYMEPEDEVEFIVGIAQQHTLVTYQEGATSHLVFVDDYEWVPHHQEQDSTFWVGTFTVFLTSLVT